MTRVGAIFEINVLAHETPWKIERLDDAGSHGSFRTDKNPIGLGIFDVFSGQMFMKAALNFAAPKGSTPGKWPHDGIGEPADW